MYEGVPLVEFMYLVFTRMPGESYRRRLWSLLLCLCDVFRALINSLVCWSIHWSRVFVCLFRCCCFFFSFSLAWSWTRYKGAAIMLLQPLPKKSRKSMTRDVLFWHFCHIFWPCLWRHWHRLLGIKWQHAISVVFATSKHMLILNRHKQKPSEKLRCTLLLFLIPLLSTGHVALLWLRVPFKPIIALKECGGPSSEWAIRDVPPPTTKDFRG